jgi:hypothetical protein
MHEHAMLIGCQSEKMRKDDEGRRSLPGQDEFKLDYKQ